MSKCFRKVLEDSITYIDKSADHKNHNFSIECILEVTFTNKSQVVTYNKKHYYKVLKCDKCLSFKGDSKEHNISGFIGVDITPPKKNTIYADYEGKLLMPGFNEYKNIRYKEKNEL